jgi:RNA ligase (TIGR02306 family)
MELASLEVITEILPIEGADRIELARVQGWQSVIKKDEYKVGDTVIFVPIDTVLPPAEWNKFLWDKKDPTKPIRVKTVKLRGTISQGLIFPRTLVSAQEIWDHMEDPSEDVSIAGMLGITKYEKPVPASLTGKVKGNFPTHLVSKTDEDNLKSNIKVLEELAEAEYVEATLKIDGTSATYIKEENGTFRVCSRNMELQDTEENVYWQMARKYNIQEHLRPGYCIQGEIAGPGIQSNPAGFSEVKLYLFNMFEVPSRKPVLPVNWIDGLGVVSDIPGVPVVRVFQNFDLWTIDDLQKWVNQINYANGKPAEGVVFRGYNSNNGLMYSQKLQKMLSVKIINQNFKD